MSYLNHLQGWPCCAPVGAQQRGRHCWLEEGACNRFPLYACRLTPKPGGVSTRSDLEKEFWKPLLIYQRIFRQVKTTCLRHFSGFTVSEHHPRSLSGSRYLGEGLMLQLWAGTKALFVFTLLQGEIPGGLGGGGVTELGRSRQDQKAGLWIPIPVLKHQLLRH